MAAAMVASLAVRAAARARATRRRRAEAATRGVLYVESVRQSWKISGRRMSLSAPAHTSRDDGSELLAYAACAHAFQDYPTPPLGGEDDAFYLARVGDPALARARNPWAWEAWGLDDPATYRRYRDSVPLGRVLTGLRACWHCEGDMYVGRTTSRPVSDSGWKWFYRVAQCPRCGWWLVSRVHYSLGMYGIAELYEHTYAVLRRFDPLAVETPLALAREHLARNPHRAARFDPFRFEELMADCLRECYGDSEIVKLGGRRDGGIDVKAVRTDGTTTLIQVKRRSDFSRREGVEVVRALHGVMLREGATHGMVISTARG
ncbi:MAG: restriction endonuclease [Conexibacter sp.]